MVEIPKRHHDGQFNKNFQSPIHKIVLKCILHGIVQNPADSDIFYEEKKKKFHQNKQPWNDLLDTAKPGQTYTAWYRSPPTPDFCPLYQEYGQTKRPPQVNQTNDSSSSEILYIPHSKLFFKRQNRQKLHHINKSFIESIYL